MKKLSARISDKLSATARRSAKPAVPVYASLDIKFDSHPHKEYFIPGDDVTGK